MDNTGYMQEWIVPILSSVVAIFVTILSCKWQMRTELKKILENYISDKKYKAYYSAVSMVFTLLEESRQKKSANPDERFSELLKIKQDLFVYGSDEAFRAFTEQSIYVRVVQILKVRMCLNLYLILC